LLDPTAVDGAVRGFLANERRSGSAAGIWILLQLQRWANRWLRQSSAPLEVARASGYQSGGLGLAHERTL
jgi:hypothetical protein